jgi:hypothetical protein
MPITPIWPSFLFIWHVVDASFLRFSLHYNPCDPGCHPEDGGSKFAETLENTSTTCRINPNKDHKIISDHYKPWKLISFNLFMTPLPWAKPSHSNYWRFIWISSHMCLGFASGKSNKKVSKITHISRLQPPKILQRLQNKPTWNSFSRMLKRSLTGVPHPNHPHFLQPSLTVSDILFLGPCIFSNEKK